jgi:hypothetical protein
VNPSITLRQALADPNLLGAELGSDSWAAWRALLLAAMGERLEPAELDLLRPGTLLASGAQIRQVLANTADGSFIGKLTSFARCRIVGA